MINACSQIYRVILINSPQVCEDSLKVKKLIEQLRNYEFFKKSLASRSKLKIIRHVPIMNLGKGITKDFLSRKWVILLRFVAESSDYKSTKSSSSKQL
jgi:hypothetical protein